MYPDLWKFDKNEKSDPIQCQPGPKVVMTFFKPVVAEPPHCSVVVVLLTVGPSLHLGDWHQTSGSPAVIPGAPPRLGALWNCSLEMKRI